MRRSTFSLFAAALLAPALASAQQPCTSDAQLVVQQLYRTILERPADGAASAMAERLRGGETTVRQLVRELALSQEHLQRFAQVGRGDANRRAVENLYRHLLGRAGDPGGVESHTQGIASKGPAEIIDVMMLSGEYQQNVGDNGVPGTEVRYCGAGAIGGGTARNRGANAGARRFSQLDARFAPMDRNRDGAIARDEFQGSNQEFRQFDSNRDGVLSGDEVRGGSAAVTFDLTAFEDADRNRDGRVERSEWPGAAAAFDSFDRNGNGVINRNEISGSTPDRFSQLDANKDGRLSFDEWDWSRRTFDQQDANRDGAVTRLEFDEQAVGTSGR